MGLAISFALPTFAQEKNKVDPEVRQQIEAVLMKFDEAYNNGGLLRYLLHSLVRLGSWSDVGPKDEKLFWRSEFLKLRDRNCSVTL